MELKGILPVLHMPYEEDEGSIDFETLQRQVDYAFETGADGICLALVSDLLRLTTEERLALPRQLVDYAAGRGPVVIHVGANTTQEATAYARAARDGGASALMATPPLTLALPESEIQLYFEAILEAAGLPLMIQDASSYVGMPMRIEFQAALFDKFGDRILFKPEASPLGPMLTALRNLTDDKALIFEGSGGVLLIESFRRGIDGTIPGVEVLDGIVALWRALEAGDEERAYDLYFPICGLGTLQLQGGLDAFIIVERYLMHKRGIFPRIAHRRPLGFELDPITRSEVDRLYDRLQQTLSPG